MSSYGIVAEHRSDGAGTFRPRTELDSDTLVMIGGILFRPLYAAMLCRSHTIADRLRISGKVTADARPARATIMLKDLVMHRRLTQDLPEGERRAASTFATCLGRLSFITERIDYHN
jgi:hypothetical protein